MAGKQQRAADRDETVDTFHEAVDMTAGRLETWPATDESKSVGQSDRGESVGHASGRSIIKLLRGATPS
ncbi:Protein of unknown function DUF3140 [Actinobacteria bacterium OV320]|nr:Protein of unknown function DUF3140 [Actinobacteria bacterium OV320]